MTSRSNLGGNLDYEHEAAGVHRRTDLRRRYFDRGSEKRWKDGLPDKAGKLGMVLVHNGGRDMIDFDLCSGRDCINGVAEGVDGKRK